RVCRSTPACPTRFADGQGGGLRHRRREVPRAHGAEEHTEGNRGGVGTSRASRARRCRLPPQLYRANAFGALHVERRIRKLSRVIRGRNRVIPQGIGRHPLSAAGSSSSMIRELVGAAILLAIAVGY